MHKGLIKELVDCFWGLHSLPLTMAEITRITAAQIVKSSEVELFASIRAILIV